MSTDHTKFDQRRYPIVDVREGYGEWVRTYEQTVLDEMDLRLLARLRGVDWAAAGDVLDLACGTGRIGAWLRLTETDDGLALALTDEDGHEGLASLALPYQAAKVPEQALDKLRDQLSRLGDTIFEPIDVAVNLERPWFVPASMLNALRRDAVAALEAARLLGSSSAVVQGDRLAAALQLCERFACTVVLKGSGTVIAAPAERVAINATGSARLATAGTGDVLAGMIGAELAGTQSAFAAACRAVHRHGLLADQWPPGPPLTASVLARL